MKMTVFVNGLYIPEIHNNKNRLALLSLVLESSPKNLVERSAQVIASAPAKDRTVLLRKFEQHFPQTYTARLREAIDLETTAREKKIKSIIKLFQLNNPNMSKLEIVTLLDQGRIKLPKFISTILNSVELSNEKNRVLLMRVLLEKFKTSGIHVDWPAQIIASTSIAKRKVLQTNIERQLYSELRVKSPTKTSSKLDAAVLLAVSNREKMIEDFKVTNGLLRPDQTKTAKQKRKKEMDDLRSDRKYFSTTFSKSRQPRIVQGGSPGSKR